MEDNVTRKRPCNEDLKETLLEDSTKKENVGGIEESNTLANKKPRFVYCKMFVYIYIFSVIYNNINYFYLAIQIKWRRVSKIETGIKRT